VPLNRVSFFRSLPKAVTKGWQFLNITTLTTGSPSPYILGCNRRGRAGGTDRPDLIKMPNFSTSRAVRADYFGLGKDNASFFSIPCQVEPPVQPASVSRVVPVRTKGGSERWAQYVPRARVP